MDWDRVIDRNHQALKRILAALLAMAGPGGAAAFACPSRGGRPSPDGRAGVVGATPPPPDASRRPPLRREADPPPPPPPEARAAGEPRRTLPRHLRNAVLRLLRPAEAAVRRLIVVAARGLVVTLPPPRPRRPRPDPGAAHAALRRLGIAVTLSPADLARLAARQRAAAKRAARQPSPPLLPLLDPLKRFSLSGPRRRTVPPHRAPRILSLFGDTPPHRLPPPPSPSDPVDATRLQQRLAALAGALDDLPAQARRFARWKARRDRALAQMREQAAAAGAQAAGGGPARRGPLPSPLPAGAGGGRRSRVRRLSPLRPGRPPGLSRAASRRPAHEVHEVLKDLQYFAREALEAPDTS